MSTRISPEPLNRRPARTPVPAGKPRHRGSLAAGMVVVALVLAMAISQLVNFRELRRAMSLLQPQREAGTNTAAHAPRVLHEVVGEREAVLTNAPLVPPAPERTPTNTKVIVHLEVVEKVLRLADGVEYMFWTFGGAVPGKFIRVREGDVVEFHLANHPDNKLPHNIDLHAVTGPGGGAEASLVAPGQQVTFTFRALNPGLFVYHCATAPVPMHIANGMYGMILVEPFEGLPPVDHEFYFMQSEIYTTGATGEKGLQTFAQEKAVREQPEYVVFNGSVGATVGDKAPVVKRGERVRLFVGNAGPNLLSSFHVIGEILDRVYVEGGSSVNENVQTTLIPAGGATIAEFTCDTPGTLNLVDHSIFRAFNKGALAQIRVIGEENTAAYSGRQDIRDYDPKNAPFVLPQDPASAMPPSVEGDLTSAPAAPATRTFSERITHGREVFSRTCIACHGPTGAGVPNVFPPLAGSDYLMAREDKGIGIVLGGLQGPVTVKGQTITSVMPPQALSDDEIASVLTYVRNTWGNKGGEVKPDEVAALRSKLGR